MKKLLAIMMAMVMVLALTVAVAADWSAEYDVAAGFTTFYNTSSDSALVDAAEAIGDDAVITFTFTSSQDLTTYSWLQLMIRDASWADDNVTLVDVKSDGTGVFSLTYAELKAAVTGTYSWNINNIIFVSNCSGDADSDVHVAVTVSGSAAPAEEAPAEEAPAEEEAAAPAEETAPAEEAPATNEAPAATAPKTGIAFAVVPAIVAMAAVAVSKKH